MFLLISITNSAKSKLYLENQTNFELGRGNIFLLSKKGEEVVFKNLGIKIDLNLENLLIYDDFGNLTLKKGNVVLLPDDVFAIRIGNNFRAPIVDIEPNRKDQIVTVYPDRIDVAFIGDEEIPMPTITTITEEPTRLRGGNIPVTPSPQAEEDVNVDLPGVNPDIVAQEEQEPPVLIDRYK